MTDQAAAPAAAPAPSPGQNGQNGAPRATLDNFQALIAHNMNTPAVPAARPANDNGRAVVPVEPNQPIDPAALERDRALGQGEPEDPAPPELADGPDVDPEAQPEPGTLLEEQLHGLSGREILEAIKAGRMPDQLAELPVTVKWNGQEYQVPIREAQAGYQRNLDYTRGKQEVRELQQRAQGTLDNVHGMIDGWREPGALRRDLEALGAGKAFAAAAVAYAKERVQDDQWQRQNPEAWRLNRQLRDTMGEIQQLKRALQQRPDTTQAAQAQRQEAEIARLAPAAFAKHGLKADLFKFPDVRNHFGQAYSAALDTAADAAEAVDRAAESTAQFLSELAERHQKAVSAQPRQLPAKNPSPLPGRTAPPTSNPRPTIYQRSLNPGDMGDYLKSLRSGRR